VQSQGRRKRRAVLAFAAYAGFAIAALAWFAFFSFPGARVDPPPPATADAPDPVDHYAGSVLIPVGTGHRCRQIAFNNNNGSLQEAGVSSCQDSIPGANSTEGRMKAIRNAFTGK